MLHININYDIYNVITHFLLSVTVRTEGELDF